MKPEITRERRQILLKLALISIALDLLTSALEVPFFFTLLGAVGFEEITETFVSTFVSRHELKLDWIDRFIGFLPIPGITAVTVAVVRELKFGPK